MTLTPELISAYETILCNPVDNGFSFTPIDQAFTPSEVATPKHILFEEYAKAANIPLEKVIFYIVMDKMYSTTIAKAPNGDLGYRLTLKN